ncbi:MAG: SPOR domain-containing protein [Prevotellaceae bacterium]|nr:SPOR domain-containing protein [Prevotellaceae bacterium]
MKKFAIPAIFVAVFVAVFVVTVQAQGSIEVKSHPAIERLVQKHISYNVQHPQIEGYRVRIYRDNSGNARQRSQDISESFSIQFPDIPAYRSYDNPYFKVSVGDFRTKDDALRFYVHIKRQYPTAYIVSEDINLPPL